MKIYEPQITGSLGINGSTIGNFNNLVSTSSFNQYTSSISTGSLATTGSNTFVGNQTISGSIIPAVTNIYDLGDDTHQFRHLYLSSGSLYINGTKVLGATGQELQITTDNGQSLKILEAGSDTITLQSADGNITLATSGGGDVILDPTSGIIALKGTTTLYAGNKVLSSDGNAIQFGNDLGITGSIVTTGNVNGINLSTFSSSITTTFSGIQSNTSSLTTRLNNIEIFSASNINTSLNEATSSYAKTNSTNIFSGNQTITGSLYVTQDLVVAGSSSIQNISSSNLVIGAAYVTVNANSPSSRYAGLLIVDSGSAGSSGSVLYDAIDDEMIFVHKGNGTNVTSSHFLLGPETYDNLGNETYLSKNRLSKGFGNEHLIDSNISDDGITISLNSNTVVTGSLTATSFTGSIGATNGVVSGSSQTIANLPTGTVSGSSQIISILSSWNTYTGSNDTTNTAQNSRLTSIESVTGSYETKGRNIVSGSSQIDVMSTTNIARLATTGSNTFRGNQSITGGDVKIGTDAGASWSYAGLTALQVRNGSYYNYTGYSGWANNIYYNGGWKYYETAGAGYAEFDINGGFSIYTAPSGVAGNTATPTQKINMTQAGQFTITDKLLIATQPSFVAYKTDNEEPTTDTILTYQNATVNRGSHYNTSTSRFTAPVAGVYAFGVKVWFKANSTGTIWVHLRKNGAVFTEQRMSQTAAASVNYTTFFPKWVISLAAGDYIEVSGYGDNANFHSSQSERYSQFYGHLLH